MEQKGYRHAPGPVLRASPGGMTEYACGCRTMPAALSLEPRFEAPTLIRLCAMHEAAPRLRDLLGRALSHLIEPSTEPESQTQRRGIVSEARQLLHALEQTQPSIPPGTGWVCWAFEKGDDYPCGHLNEEGRAVCAGCGAPRSA